MAIPAFAPSKTSILSASVSKIEVRALGTGSFVDVGSFTGFSLSATTLSQDCDPAGSQQAYAIEYTVSFTLVQTSKTIELAGFMAGTAGTGLYETDAEVKITFIGGRTISLGTVTACPMRIIASLAASGEGAQVLNCTATVVEPITSLGGKVA